ncbi:polysaccharide biosynthesis/export family protein [Mucilaginibacter sp. AK015]|uniref:polysaccharide biosynthesis/export family protein n=1 Tax=Mucilaginibacter sp. AK015 TaxID=2723072 RepID=UPI001607764C|nr:polysaccharide biosynthesis/export family protein [Mucilaginibacter sp. AK015]MBB5396061.1 polysaccharide export outer membrane protein [Mucilaginibacter sp. AK015]
MKKNIYRNIFLFLIAAIAFSSCIGQKEIVYFQKDLNQSDTINVAEAYVPKIQPGDILSIPVNSLNPAASSFFNPYAPATSATDITTTNAQNGAAPLSQTASNGYLVDANGEIEMPLISTIKVGGLTTAQARDIIREKLKQYLKEPTVNVRFLNYKISVMGEVARPSVYVIPNEKVTLPEALTMAGDLTIYGKRDNILIVRDNGGKKEFGRVNLNTREVFTSPYYYLHSGDLIYVEQGKGKAAQSDQAYRIVPIILSALTVIGLLIYRFK